MTRKILAICAALLLAFGAVAEGFTAISAGGAHALAVDEKGGVWAWGSNVRGESVPGSADARVTEPVKVLGNVVSVACGRNFSLALTSDGALYGWGDHRSNQLPGASDAPVLLREGVLSMDACEERAVLVTETGEVYAWGAGENLHLLCENAAEAAVGVDFILVRLKTGEVYEYPDSADYSDEYEPAGGAKDSGNGDASDPAGGTENSGNGDASEPADGVKDSGNGDANEPASGAEDSGNGDASEPAGGAEDSGNGDASEPAGGAENSGNGDASEPAGGAKDSGNGDASEPAGGTEHSDNGDTNEPAGGAKDSGNGDANEPAGGVKDSGNGDASDPAGGVKESGNGDASEPAGGAEHSDNGDTNEPAGGAENSGNGDASEPAGGTEDSGNGDTNDPAGGVKDSGSGDANEPAGGVKDSANGGAGEAVNVEDSAKNDVSKAANAEISGDGGAKSSADGADVLAEGDAGGVTDTAKDSGDSNLSESVVGVKKLEGATEIDACGQTRMARTEDGTLYIWGAAGTDGRLGLAVNGWVDTPMPLELADVRTFSAGLTTSGAITESGEACLWGTVYSYVVLYDVNGDPAASVVDGLLVSYGSAPVRLYDNAQALAFGDAFVLLLRSDGAILAWGSNDHGQMADGDWTKAELADGDDEDEKDVVITESDQFVFPAVIAVPAES
ncbi:MAG: hypothetical protein MR914_04985 [Clostridiales bacterium]|nr:hypothetical protein [Clostridiales bacterium]